MGSLVEPSFIGQAGVGFLATDGLWYPASVLRLVLAAVWTLLASSCIEVDGGAVEVSWILRTDDGFAIDGCDCADPKIDRVRFEVVAIDADGVAQADACAGRGDCVFSCGRGTGATDFDIPPGRYGITIVPLDADGQDLRTPGASEKRVRTPERILRDVVNGQVTQLDALAIVANDARSCSLD